MDNYWSEFEYSKLKLLLNHRKVDSILSVLTHQQTFDDLYPLSVELHLTDYCNLRCEWCTDKKLHKHPYRIDYDTVCALIRELSAHETGITFEGGGEPTLHDRFHDIVRYGYSCGAAMGLITNGTTDLSEVMNCFKWIRISVDAGSPEEYLAEKGVNQFDAVIGHLKKYRSVRDKRHTHLGVGYVLTNRNCENVEEFVCMLDQLEVDYIYLRPVEECDRLRPDRDRLYALKQRLSSLTQTLRIKFVMVIDERYEQSNAQLPCVAHSLTSIIHASGDVVLCEKRRHDMKMLGNVNQSSFRDIWTSKCRQEISQSLLDPGQQQGCSVCRQTGFNRVFCELLRVNTRNFI